MAHSLTIIQVVMITNIYQVYEEETNVTTLFVIAFADSFMEEPVNCYPLTQIGGRPL